MPCEHAQTFYRKIATDPVVLWKIARDAIDLCSDIRKSPSDTGDECHYELFAEAAVQTKIYKEYAKVCNMVFCTDSGVAVLDQQILDSIKKSYPSSQSAESVASNPTSTVACPA